MRGKKANGIHTVYGQELLEELRQAVVLERTARARVESLVTELTADTGRPGGDIRASWGDVAAVLGVTRQAAQQRYGRKRPAESKGEPLW